MACFVSNNFNYLAEAARKDVEAGDWYIESIRMPDFFRYPSDYYSVTLQVRPSSPVKEPEVKLTNRSQALLNKVRALLVLAQTHDREVDLDLDDCSNTERNEGDRRSRQRRGISLSLRVDRLPENVSTDSIHKAGI